MGRTFPELTITPPAGDVLGRAGVVVKSHRFHVITPLLGGGVVTGKPDPLTPIRPSSIRGHLRFWWRATRGARCRDTSELRKTEADIWGSTSHASRVHVTVNIARSGAEPTFVLPNYLLFPIQPSAKRFCLTGVEFDLTLRWRADDPDISQDIEAALWAWSNFGGIGSRTRRGSGALYSKDFDPELELKDPDLDLRWAKFARVFAPTERRPWPCLSFDARPRIDLGKEEPVGAWVGVIEDFRQARQNGYASSLISPDRGTRTASPIILRPIAFDDRGKLKASRMVVPLHTNACGANEEPVRGVLDYIEKRWSEV